MGPLAAGAGFSLSLANMSTKGRSSTSRCLLKNAIVVDLHILGITRYMFACKVVLIPLMYYWGVYFFHRSHNSCWVHTDNIFLTRLLVPGMKQKIPAMYMFLRKLGLFGLCIHSSSFLGNLGLGVVFLFLLVILWLGCV